MGKTTAQSLREEGAVSACQEISIRQLRKLVGRSLRRPGDCTRARASRTQPQPPRRRAWPDEMRQRIRRTVRIPPARRYSWVCGGVPCGMKSRHLWRVIVRRRGSIRSKATQARESS